MRSLVATASVTVVKSAVKSVVKSVAKSAETRVAGASVGDVRDMWCVRDVVGYKRREGHWRVPRLTLNPLITLNPPNMVARLNLTVPMTLDGP
jgi:hypothetical protein